MQGSLWRRCLTQLEAELPEAQFNTWIRPLQAVEDGHTLRLLAPNRFVVDWVNENVAGRISELVDAVGSAPAPAVVLEVGSRAMPAPAPIVAPSNGRPQAK
ncbi:MAG: DnaA N-terminal domain-containing protein, partial [Steroidobacteraceae bacterium]